MNITVESAINDYFFHCEFERNLSKKTIKAYRIDLMQFVASLNFSIAETTINNIDKIILQNYIKSLFSKYRVKSIRRKVNVLKGFFNFLERDDLILNNPFRKMHIRIKEPRPLPRTIEIKHIEKLFQFLYSQSSLLKPNSQFGKYSYLRDTCIIELLFTTGARVSEISSLQLCNVKIEDSTIVIHGKGNRERIAHLFDYKQIKTIKYYLNERERLFSENSFLFINRFGNPMSEQSIRFMLRKRFSEAGLKLHVTPHMFRHTFATSLLSNGVDIRQIQELLGHSSILTTQIYTHIAAANQGKILSQKHPRCMFNV